jgi:uncharacterized protein (TIGR02001 family)
MRCRAPVPLVATALCAALGAAPRAAADGPWSGSIVGTTDYVFRGISQTYGGAVLQGAINYQHVSGWFGGAWASNVDPYPFGRESTEINLYAGFGRAFGPDWSARTSYTRYHYARDRRPSPYDYGEFAATLAFRDLLSATVSYQPDSSRYSTLGYARHRPAAAYEVTGRWPLPYGFALTGGVGYYDLTHLFHASYWAGGAGLSYVRGHFELDLTRFVSDGTVYRLFEDATADGQWVLAGAWRF